MLQKSSLGALGGQGRSKVEQKRNFNENVTSRTPQRPFWISVRYPFLFGTTLEPNNYCLGKDPFRQRFYIQFLQQHWKFSGPEMLPELTQKQYYVREHTGNDKLCFDCAGVSGSRVGSSRKVQKTGKTIVGPVFAYVGF